MDLHFFCKTWYHSTGIPVILAGPDGGFKRFGFTDEITVSDDILQSILSAEDSLSFFETRYNFFYGCVRCGASAVILGPFFTTPVTRTAAVAFMNENQISARYTEDVRRLLSKTPPYEPGRFASTLALAELALNGRQIENTQILAMPEAVSEEISQDHAEASFEEQEDRFEHGTFYFENQMLGYVRDGNTAGLIRFLTEAASAPMPAGTVGDSPLRQAKNIFIGNVARVGKDAAIPGGMDIEEAYRLIDRYSQKCERYSSIRDIDTLTYQMLVDFSDRVAKAKMPLSMSDEAYACILYINEHLNEPICVDDVAESIHRSASYINKKFRNELGFSVGQYIIHARVNEAKSLLLYTGKTLNEITTYLCFSSQPYFQNVFKKVAGMTPLEYRRRQRLIGRGQVPPDENEVTLWSLPAADADTDRSPRDRDRLYPF